MFFYFDAFQTLEISRKDDHNLERNQHNVRLFHCKIFTITLWCSTKLLNRSKVNKLLKLKTSNIRLSQLLKDVEFFIN